MHEMGLIVHVLKTAKRVARENDLQHIDQVRLEIGEVSGIVPDYLYKYWRWAIAKEEPLLQQADLHIRIIPAKTVCEDCHAIYETVRYGKECPHCHSSQTFLIQGNEMMIDQISGSPVCKTTLQETQTI